MSNVWMKDSWQMSRCWTASQPASCWAEEAGPFITGCCSSLGKWSICSWQMWVSFIGQNDRLCRHELDVVGLSETLQRWWGAGHVISSVYFGLVIFNLHVTFARMFVKFSNLHPTCQTLILNSQPTIPNCQYLISSKWDQQNLLSYKLAT